MKEKGEKRRGISESEVCVPPLGGGLASRIASGGRKEGAPQSANRFLRFAERESVPSLFSQDRGWGKKKKKGGKNRVSQEEPRASLRKKGKGRTGAFRDRRGGGEKKEEELSEAQVRPSLRAGKRTWYHFVGLEGKRGL